MDLVLVAALAGADGVAAAFFGDLVAFLTVETDFVPLSLVGAAFLAGDVLAVVFLAGAFFTGRALVALPEAFFLAGAFFTAAFLATGLVAAVFLVGEDFLAGLGDEGFLAVALGEAERVGIFLAMMGSLGGGS
ncbi:hypothetical protein [Actomonas aquatica]|uniref:Uncharacterized protein n=1 Tax=Actomonas aquatica TaxID=2866162 RepID=A0ABZ1CAY2_9BACT|nr:hypothetical protein [Opitutus sp. WL0086]WRQ88859.1 hypothetical protein K1X11_005540 [Opitutus sp. WL0086]